MPVTLEEKTDLVPPTVPPTYSCFFEQAEHVIETLLVGKDAVVDVDDHVTDNIRLVQHASSFTTVELLNKAVSLRSLQRKTRLGKLMQPDLVAAIDRLSHRI